MPSFRCGSELLSSPSSVHGRVSHVVAVAESATSRALYVDGVRVAESSAAATLFQAGAPRIALHAVREYNFGAWNTSGSNLRILGGAWFKRAPQKAEAEAISGNIWQIFRADPLRIYSLPSGPITLNSLTMSNITQTTARATLSLAR